VYKLLDIIIHFCITKTSSTFFSSLSSLSDCVIPPWVSFQFFGPSLSLFAWLMTLSKVSTR